MRRFENDELICCHGIPVLKLVCARFCFKLLHPEAFSGTSGLQYERDILEKAEQYTITTWVKFDELPWNIGSDMVLFDLQPGFNCKLKITKSLSCKPKDQFSLDNLKHVFMEGISNKVNIMKRQVYKRTSKIELVLITIIISQINHCQF